MSIACRLNGTNQDVAGAKVSYGGSSGDTTYPAAFVAMEALYPNVVYALEFDIQFNALARPGNLSLLGPNVQVRSRCCVAAELGLSVDCVVLMA